MENREHVVNDVRKDVERVAGSGLVSLFLYGSALTEQFVDHVSDYNFGLVADPVDVALLERLQELAGRWEERRVPVPVLFSPKFFLQARDSFPLEFLAMKASYRVISGADLIADLEIDVRDVRLECEWELRSKLLVLRRQYVRSHGDPVLLHATVVEAVPAFTAILRGCLFFLGRKWDAKEDELWPEVHDALGMPAGLMPALIEERRKRVRGGSSVKPLYIALLEATEVLVQRVDSW
ncbi:MAG: hypothetical protein R3E97_00245 [Candidatus Eisenbacteria bacterium]